MSNLLEGLIAKGRHVNNVKDQREIAFGLADLSTRPEFHSRMVQKGGMKTLLRLLTQSSDVEAQRFAALAIANTASSEEVKVDIAQEVNLVPYILNYIHEGEGDIIGKQHCSMAIGNLASAIQNHSNIMMNSSTIPILVEFLKQVTIEQNFESSKYAAFALSNLFRIDEFREQAVKEGVVEHLILAACFEDIQVQKHSLLAIRGLCRHPDFRPLVISAGILDPLILLARSKDEEILREAAATFNGISCSHAENKYEISDRAMTTMIHLLISDDAIVQRHMVSAIANLTQVFDIQTRFVDENGLSPLVSIFSCGCSEAKGEAARVLANMSLNEGLHSKLLYDEVLRGIVKGLLTGGIRCKTFSALFLANVARCVTAQIKIAQSGSIRLLRQIIVDEEMAVETRRYAVLAITNLSATEANHKLLLEEQILDAIFTLSSAPDLLCKRFVAHSLCNLASNLRNNTSMVEEGCIQPLILLAYNPDLSIQLSACAAIRGLSASKYTSIKIVQEGGLDPLYRLLSSKDVLLVSEVCACLSNLSLDDDVKNEIMNCGLVSLLVDVLEQDENSILMYCASALANLAELRHRLSTIASEHVIKRCVSLMRSHELNIQREIGRLLSNICMCNESKTIGWIVEYGGHYSLMSFLSSRHESLQRIGAFGIGNLTASDNHRIVLKEARVLDPLSCLVLSEDSDLESKILGMRAIFNMSLEKQNHDTFMKERIFHRLLSFSVLNNELRLYAALTISNLSTNMDWIEEISEQGGLEPVLYLARKDTDLFRREALIAIAALSFLDRNRSDICSHGGLLPILQMLSDEDNYLVQYACCAVANLSERDDTMMIVIQTGCFDLLIKTFCNRDYQVVHEAIRAIGNISTNLDYSSEIAQPYELTRKLVLYLSGSEIRSKRMSAMALSNLGANSIYRCPLMDEYSINVLFKEFSNIFDSKVESDIETIRFLLVLVSNLSIYHECHSVVLRNFLDFLIHFSNHNDLKCREYSVLALGNLCSSPDNLCQLHHAGVPSILISFAFPSLVYECNSTRFQAISGLRGLSMKHDMRSTLIQSGCLDALILSASKSESAFELEIRQEALATISNLSLSMQNGNSIVKTGIVPAIIDILKLSQDLPNSYLCGALANMAEGDQVVQRTILNEKCLAVFLHILLSKSLFKEEIEEIARCFVLLSMNNSFHEKSIESAVLDAMKNILVTETSIKSKIFTLLTICNIVQSQSSHEALFSAQIFSILPDLLTMKNIHIKQIIAYLLHNVTRFCPKGHQVFLDNPFCCTLSGVLEIEDKLCRVHACLAARYLSLSQSWATEFLKSGCFSKLCLLLRSENNEIRKEITGALVNLSMFNQIKPNLLQEGCVSSLMNISRSSDDVLVKLVYGVIANIAEIDTITTLLVNEGILQHLNFSLKYNHDEVKRECVRTMSNLSQNPDCSKTIGNSGLLFSLVKSVSAEDELCQMYAILTISNLSTDMDNRRRLIEVGCMHPLLYIYSNSNSDDLTTKLCLCALSNLSASKDVHELLLDSNILDICFSIMERSSDVLLQIALTCLANFASNVNCHSSIENSPCFPWIVSTINRLDGRNLINSLLFLRGLSTSRHMRMKLIRMQVVESLFGLLPQEKIIQNEILYTICNLSLDFNIGDHSGVYISEIFHVDDLLRLLNDDNMGAQIFSSIFIGNAQSEFHTSILNSQVVESLIIASQTTHFAELKRCVAYALCNLCHDSTHRTLIAKPTGLTSIFHLFDSFNECDVFNGVTTIRAISEELHWANDIVEIGFLHHLIDVCDRKISDRCTYSALEAIYWLSLNDKFKRIILSDRNISCLMNVIPENVCEFRSHISSTLFRIIANCGEIHDFHSDILEHLSHLLVAYHKSFGVATKREIIRLISNLCSKKENHERLLSDNVLNILFNDQICEDSVVRKYKCHAILNFSINPGTHQRLYECRADIVNLFLGDLAHEAESSNVSSAIQPVCITLGCLFSFPLFRVYFKGKSVCGFLCHLLSQRNFEIKVAAVFSVHQFYKYTDDTTMDHPFIHLKYDILQLLSYTVENLIIHLLAAFCHVVRKINFCDELVTKNGLLLISSFVHASASLEMQRIISALLFCITLTGDIRCHHALIRTFKLALELCKSSDSTVLKFAIATLANVFDNVSTYELLTLEQDFIHTLVLYLRLKDLSIKRESLRLLANILSNIKTLDDFINAQGLEAMELLSKSDDTECQYYCALSLRKITSCQKYNKYLISKGSLRTIYRLIEYKDENINATRFACLALIDIADCKDVLDLLPKTDVINKVIELLACGDDLTETLGASIISRFTFSLPLIRKLMDHDSFQNLYYGSNESKCEGYLTHIAASLSNICKFDEFRIKIWKHEKLFELLKNLFQKKSGTINFFLARSMAFLSSDISDSLSFELESYMIKLLLSLIRLPQEEIVLFSLMGLGNFARDRNHQLLMNDLSVFAAIEPIILTSEGRVLSMALWVLSRTSVPDENVHHLLNQTELLQRLVNLIQSKDSDILQHLGNSLCNILSYEQARVHLLTKKLFPALIASMQYQDSENILSFTKSVCNSLLSEDVRANVVDKNVILTLLQISRNESHNCREAAIVAFSNLCIDKKFCKTLCIAGAIGRICSYIHLDLMHYSCAVVAMAFYNISRCDDSHCYLTKEPIINYIFSLCVNTDAECRSLALVTLSNLSANDCYRCCTTKYRGVQTAISLVGDMELDCQISACIYLSNLLIAPTTRSQSVFHGCIQALKSALLSKNKALCLHAKLALINVTASLTNHEHLLNHDIFNILLSDRHDHDILTGLVMVNVTANGSLMSSLSIQSVTAALMILISHRDIHFSCCGLFAFQHLIHQDNDTDIFYSEEFFRQLERICLIDEVQLQQGVARCLDIMSNKPHQARNVSKKSIGLIEVLSTKMDPDTLSSIASMIANFCEQKCYCVPDSVLKKLLSLLENENINVAQQACRAVAMMSFSAKLQEKIIAYGGLDNILCVREMQDKESEYFVSLTLSNLVMREQTHTIMIESAFSNFNRILLKRNENRTVYNVLKALAILSTRQLGEASVAYTNLINPLCDQLESDEADLVSLAAFILLRLSFKSHFHEEIINEGAIIAKVTCAIRGGSTDLFSCLSGLLANLSTFDSNRAILIKNGIVSTLIALSSSSEKIASRYVVRAFANLSANKMNNFAVYDEGGLVHTMKLLGTLDSFGVRFAVLAITLLCTNKSIRNDILKNDILNVFDALENFESDEFRIGISIVYALFSSDDSHRACLVPKYLPIIVSLCQHSNLFVKKYATITISNIAECKAFQSTLFEHDVVQMMANIACSLVDVDTIRAWSRFYALLSFTDSVRQEIFCHQLIQFIIRFGRRSDLSTQRYSIISLCNFCWFSAEKSTILSHGAVCRTLLYLSDCSDEEVEKCALLCLAALASVANKEYMKTLVDMGALDSLLKGLHYPDIAVKQCASFATDVVLLSCSTESITSLTKDRHVMQLFLSLLDTADDECIHNAIFAIGSLIESIYFRKEFVNVGALDILTSLFHSASTKVKRSCGYVYCVLAEQKEFHHILSSASAIQIVVHLAGMLDEQCQMYGSFCLVALAANPDLRIVIANMGAVRNLVTILCTESLAHHYAALALLKLSENFETHIIIAEEGGIKALLKLCEEGSTSRYLKYKAASALSNLASETIAGLPKISYLERDRLNTRRI